MGANLDRLMKSYGISTPVMSGYSGSAAPTALAADATAEQQGAYAKEKAKYDAQRAGYDQYVNDYKNRIMSTDLYSSPALNIYSKEKQKSQWDTPLKTPDYLALASQVKDGTSPDYAAMINTAYGTLGRSGIGTNPGNIDQAGYDHWMDQLKSGAVSPSAFQSTFTNSANDYMAQNPDSAVTQYVQRYSDPISSIDNTTRNPLTISPDPGVISMGPDDWAYAHGGPVRHFARGGIGRVDGGINDLADKYAMDNPAELPEIYAAADTGTMTDASAPKRTDRAPAPSVPVSDSRLRDMQNSAVRVGEPPMQRGPAPEGEAAPQMTTPMPVAAAPADDAREALYRKYFTRPAESSALVEARKKSADSQAAFLKAVNDQMGKTEENAPSKAEMYFRLAAAFAAPTKTGGVMENVALAAKELADFQKSTTDAKKAAAAAKLQLLLKTNEITWQVAKEELAALEKAESEENVNRRTFGTELIKEQQKNLEPKSELGRRAADEGFAPGTTAHKQRVSELSKADEAQKAQTLTTQAASEKRKAEEATKLTQPETKLKLETEETVARIESAAQDLKKAFALNPNTFAGSWGEKAEMFVKEGLGIKDPIAINTREQRNLLSSQALAALKETFPGAISNDERKALLDLQGVDAKTLQEREVIIKRAYQSLQTSLARNKKRLESINKGEFRSTTKSEGAPSDGQ